MPVWCDRGALFGGHARILSQLLLFAPVALLHRARARDRGVFHIRRAVLHAAFNFCTQE